MNFFKKNIILLLRCLAKPIARKDALYKFFRQLFAFVFIIEYRRYIEIENRNRDKYFLKYPSLFKDIKVLKGPFTNLLYPSKYVPRQLFQKLLGTYEAEIQNLVEKLIHVKYENIINIGCAEGYYLIGFGVHNRKAKLYGFDIDFEILEYCNKMAFLNQVDKRLALDARINPEILGKLLRQLKSRTLIISDCEGYEKKLFSTLRKADFKFSDMLIETHDHIAPGSTAAILDAFSPSHQAHQIVIDHNKFYSSRLEIVDHFNIDEKDKLQLIDEHRTITIQWLFLQSRANPIDT